MTTRFKFALGEIVCLDPTGKGNGLAGKIIGRIEFLDGSIGYVVTAPTFSSSGGISRHQVAECEIHGVTDSSDAIT